MTRENVGGRQWATVEWFASGVLDPLLEINNQCIDLLCGMADAGASGMPLLQGLAPLWRVMGQEARRRLASCPYLLVDAGFADESRWRQLVEHRVSDQPREWRVACFGGERAQGLARRVLTYGWYLARSHPSVARVALGMSPACVARISALGLRDLDLASEVYPGWIRPRWESQVAVWRQLLTAASSTDEPAMQKAALRGIPLLAAGTLPSGPRRGPVN